MSHVPDVIGYTCKEAIKAIEKAGWLVSIQETMPPKQQSKDGECRVIRQIQSNERIEIVISYF
ncbi:PASTA domain-containing protein [Geosporobacter ferrireducens]|uniref:PASTA domain-containing protein n=1 Tax=Geosporobacter ferrireducens TaxID=1424294 RepID=A0A1D8GBG1_9FIRM|nr:PASTA domain-containing protein [Geosporobacter ferrireducens]AOT68246.1 hypothetical protein Gferi_00780 [Geosporobacter ferrireducens]